jgi:hypothetical protein
VDMQHMLSFPADCWRDAASGSTHAARLCHYLPAQVYLFHLLSQLKELSIRSAIIFASTCKVVTLMWRCLAPLIAGCRTCMLWTRVVACCCRDPGFVYHQGVVAYVQGAHMLGYVLEELGLQAASLHSRLNQRRRLAALHRFKSGADGRTTPAAVTQLQRCSPAVKLSIVCDERSRKTCDDVYRCRADPSGYRCRVPRAGHPDRGPGGQLRPADGAARLRAPGWANCARRPRGGSPECACM